MNILVTAKLGDNKLLSKLVGLQACADVDTIYLVRKSPLAGKKIANVTPSRFVAESKILFELWRFFTLIRLLRFSPVDHVLGIQFFMHGMAAVIAAKLCGKKAIVWLIGSDVMLHGRRLWLKRLFAYCLARANKILTMGPAMNRALPEHLRGRVVEIQSYIDPNIYYPIEHSQVRWDFGFVGNLERVKRVDRLIDAMACLKQRDGSFRLVIVGDGTQKQSLEARVKRLSLDEQVSFLGRREDVARLINQMSAVVLSSDSEGFPAVILEASFCGKPVISTDVGEVRQYYDHYPHVVIANEKTPADVADSMYRLHLALEKNPGVIRESALNLRGKYLDQWSSSALGKFWSDNL